MAVEFGVEIERMVRRPQREAEIVHGENVFQQFGIVKIADAAGLSRRVEFVRGLVGARIEIVIVLRFVDAHAPENDGRVVPIALDHGGDIAHCQVLPVVFADVLPAGNLFEHEQAELIAGIQEMPRLRIVRSADEVEFQFFFEDHSITMLRACGHSATHVRKCLVAIQPTQLDVFAVQHETFGCEARLAKADTGAEFVGSVFDDYVVELRVGKAPKLDVAQIRQSDFRPFASGAWPAHVRRRAIRR